MTGISKRLALVSVLALAACSGDFHREMGSEVDKGQFGNATMHNALIQTGQLEYTIALAERFNAEVPDTVNFAFNSAQLDAEARAILDRQANFIRQFPEVRFKVFGHTDLVGSQNYNYGLGKRRANAVVGYLVSRGVSKSRLEAVVSYGKSRPIIQTSAPEERNRRTVTEVSGFVKDAPLVLNGKYAQIIWRNYTQSAERIHPSNNIVAVQVSE
ncbi:OmpA family protein [Pseudogemmobacter humi]|uniref:Outer membrane lipoprotein Omp16 n=1 Tax=Pseudogemmobacter humi TaxID=2483812 RepID=A0A3P5XX65_9RHOB|nr:OmpA family protein [Pseudogemmobacter humi]VDC32756.1 Outer membrane lipoprotein Omp16 precursor [Pseudogemmobacter humi]